MQAEQFNINIMRYMYLFSILSLVWFSNKACGFPASLPSSSLNSCTDEEEEIAKRCGSLKLSEILSSQGFTGPIMIASLSTMFVPVINILNSKNGEVGDWAFQSQFPQNISSFSSNHINCQLYERYTQCIDEHGIPDRCFSKEDFITRASYGYICGVGKVDYLQSANCLERMDDYNALAHQSQAKAECQSNKVKLLDEAYAMMATMKTTNMIQWLNDYLYNQEYLLCLIREDVYSCTGPWVRRQCGEKAESLVQGMVEHVMKSLTDFYKEIDSNFEILSICAAQDVMNVPQHGGGISETYIAQVLQDLHNRIDEMRPILGKCSSGESMFNFIICWWQVIQESPALMMIANSGSLLGWFEQACNSGLGRFQSCIVPKLEICPEGVIADMHKVIKVACASFSDIEPMSGCYLPVVDNIPSACGINTGEIQASISMIGRYTIDDTHHSAFNKGATMIIRKSKSMKCAVQYQKNVTLSKLPQRCGSKLKSDVEHIFDLLYKIAEHMPKWINTSLEELQAINNYSNHIVCSDTAKGMVQKCEGQNLINSLNENSLFGTLLHNLRLNGFIHSPKAPQSSFHGLQRRFTRSLIKNAPNDIFVNSTFTAETVSSTSVEKACRKYEAYEQCLDKTVDIFGCNTDAQIKSSWGYMCGRGKPDLMLSVSCLIELDVVVMQEWMKGPEADTCRSVMRKSMASLDSPVLADMMCLTRVYSDACLEAMAKFKCGQHASDFYRGLVESILEEAVARIQAIDPSFKPTSDCI